MKKILFAILAGCSMFSNAQDVQKDEITKSVIRIVDSKNRLNKYDVIFVFFNFPINCSIVQPNASKNIS